MDLAKSGLLSANADCVLFLHQYGHAHIFHADFYKDDWRKSNIEPLFLSNIYVDRRRATRCTEQPSYMCDWADRCGGGVSYLSRGFQLIQC